VRTVHLELCIAARPPGEVYATLADFGRYPDLSEAVRAVSVERVAADVTVSRWEVAFRAGLLRWVEEDTFDRAAGRITFRQLEGDVAVFDGSWQCAATDITFDARIDMGIPSLADALEPIAARTLVENTVSIVSGLFGGATVAASHVAAAALAGSRP
jgi:hypothetical protein